MLKCWRTGLLGLGFWVALTGEAQMVGRQTPPPEGGSMQLDVTPRPLLSIDSLSFLEGTWTAERGADAAKIGSYAFVRELDGKILARRSTTDTGCAEPASTVCAHRDLFYVFQDSAGAPLKAIYFDVEGHVIRYDVEIRHGEVSHGRQDYAIFESDPSALGPRFRLSYERNTDTLTQKTSLSGKFEVLLPNGIWHPQMEWGGRLVGAK